MKMSYLYRLQLLRVRVHILKLKNDLNIQRREVEDIRREIFRPRGPVRPWLTRRGDHGLYERLMEELKREDVAAFTNMLRMSPQLFQEIVDRLDPILNPNVGFAGRPPHPTGLKVAITLRYLATGDS
ncbi:MAG: hypothetical protein GY698_09360, partial [Actinomycetia bacterium]|nr:hypothetical protein [Actinomycetes bacterium]